MKRRRCHGRKKNEIILTYPCANRLRSARLKTFGRLVSSSVWKCNTQYKILQSGSAIDTNDVIFVHRHLKCNNETILYSECKTTCSIFLIVNYFRTSWTLKSFKSLKFYYIWATVRNLQIFLRRLLTLVEKISDLIRGVEWACILVVRWLVVVRSSWTGIQDKNFSDRTSLKYCNSLMATLFSISSTCKC